MHGADRRRRRCWGGFVYYSLPLLYSILGFGVGEFRGRRQSYSQWKPHGFGRGNNPNYNRESHFDLRENLNQNRKNMEGGDVTLEGSKSAEDPQVKDTAQSDNSDKREQFKIRVITLKRGMSRKMWMRRRDTTSEVHAACVVILGTCQMSVLDQLYVQGAKKKDMSQEYVMRYYPANA